MNAWIAWLNHNVGIITGAIFAMAVAMSYQLGLNNSDMSDLSEKIDKLELKFDKQAVDHNKLINDQTDTFSKSLQKMENVIATD
jgi:hypothetical protein